VLDIADPVVDNEAGDRSGTSGSNNQLADNPEDASSPAADTDHRARSARLKRDVNPKVVAGRNCHREGWPGKGWAHQEAWPSHEAASTLCLVEGRDAHRNQQTPDLSVT
jgi:hypothetical protein